MHSHVSHVKMHDSYYTYMMYREQMCSKCQSEEATVHCKDCGPFVYLCQACTIVIHSDPIFLGNAFHLPQLWTAVYLYFYYYYRMLTNIKFCMFNRAISRDSNTLILYYYSPLMSLLVRQSTISSLLVLIQEVSHTS